MRGLAITIGLLIGAMVATALLASGLQERATATHRIPDGFSPGGETGLDHRGWPIDR